MWQITRLDDGPSDELAQNFRIGGEWRWSDNDPRKHILRHIEDYGDSSSVRTPFTVLYQAPGILVFTYQVKYIGKHIGPIEYYLLLT